MRQQQASFENLLANSTVIKSHVKMYL